MFVGVYMEFGFTNLLDKIADGAANGRQPIHSETNQTSAAAVSRR